MPFSPKSEHGVHTASVCVCIQTLALNYFCMQIIEAFYNSYLFGLTMIVSRRKCYSSIVAYLSFAIHIHRCKFEALTLQTQMGSHTIENDEVKVASTKL